MIKVQGISSGYRLGIVLSVAYLVLTSFQVVFSRFAITEFSISPSVSIILALMIGSFVQLAYAGYGYGLFFTKTLKDGYTWLYTIMQLVMNIAGIYVLVYITTTEAFLLQRLSIIVSLVLGFLFLSRQVKVTDFIGISLILFGIGLVLSGFDKVTAITVMLLVTIAGFMSAGRALISEVHPIYSQARNNEERIRCTGVITLVSSFLFLVFIFTLSLLKSFAGADVDIQLINWAPNLDEFLNRYNFYYGVIIGFFVIPLDTWLFFRKNNLLTSEISMMTTAFMPLVILCMEFTFSVFGLLDIRSITSIDLIAGAIIMLGAVYLMAVRLYSSKPKLSRKEKAFLKDAKVLVLAGLEFTNGNKNKLSKVLSISPKLISLILDNKAILKPSDINKIRKNFTEKIALFDSLTGLQNRIHFKASIQELKHSKNVSLLFLDLNKFKPVNDAYGHDAGDELLKKVAQRLHKKYPNYFVTRFGGDEFCLLLNSVAKAKALEIAQEVRDLIKKPYKLELAGVKEKISISASVGVANYPQDVKSVDELIKLADQKMYDDK